jgi:hypothetical protein
MFSDSENLINLGQRMPSSDINTAEYNTAPYSLAGGGAFDGIGNEDAASGVYKLTKSFTIWFDTVLESETYFKSLRALTGRKGKLYREWDSTGNIEWVSARMVSIAGTRELENQRHVEVNCTFEIYSAYWHGEINGTWYLDDDWYFDTGMTLDGAGDTQTLTTSPFSYTLTIDGNSIINNPIITVTAGSASITAFEIKNTTPGHLSELDYAGTIIAGESLVIDCGAYTVLNDGTDDDANLSIGATHGINEWFRLAAGANTITATITGGSTNSTVTIDYYEGWK